MTRPSPYVIELSDADRAVLGARVRAYTAPYHEVFRARIVILAAGGLENVVIAERLDTSTNVVSRWLAADALKPWQHRSWGVPARPRVRGQGRTGARPVPAPLV